MYKDDPKFEKPDENAKIWRYMDFTHFMAMLDSGYLYFCPREKLREADPWEGSLSYHKLLKDAEPGIAEQFTQKMESCGFTITVNCWHLNEDESAAMWELYANLDNGVAIQSTFKRLISAVDECPHAEVRIGKIKYIDYKKPDSTGLDIFSPCLRKRKSYKHEKELRAIIWDTGSDVSRDEIGGVCLPIDLKKLIQSIYVSPKTPSWVLELIKSIIGKYEIEVTVQQSGLLTGPSY